MHQSNHTHSASLVARFSALSSDLNTVQRTGNLRELDRLVEASQQLLADLRHRVHNRNTTPSYR